MKKISLVLLAIFLLSACVSPKKEKSSTLSSELDKIGKEYVQQLLHYQAREKDRSDREGNPDFDAFLTSLFDESLEGDYMSQRYMVSEPEKMGLEKPEVSLGTISLEDKEESIRFHEEELAKLREFDFNSLSFRQQIDYEAAEYSYLEGLATTALSKYDLLFTESGLLSDLVTNFTEFVITSKEDVEDYFTLLEDIERYLKEAMVYTQQQAEEGIALQNISLDETQRFVREFVASKEQNSLIVTFADKMAEIDFLNEQEKQEALTRNKDIVLQKVLPAYEETSQALEALRGKSKLSADDAGLAGYNSDYAQLMLMIKASSNLSADELFAEGIQALVSAVTKVSDLGEDSPSLQEYLTVRENIENYPVLTMTPREALEYNREKMTKVYPDIGEISYTISELDPSSISSSIMAYFLHGTLDSEEGNVIRINPAALGDDLISTYITLSHEGIPGHLYQDVYFRKQQPHNYRELLSFIGYSEGHAMMSELDALHWVGFKEEHTADLFSVDVVFGYILQACVDIGVNVYGWDKAAVRNFLKDWNMEEESEIFYEGVVANPGGIIPYGIGLAQLMNLREQTASQRGENFDLAVYNDIILRHGPLPFFMVKEEVRNYDYYQK